MQLEGVEEAMGKARVWLNGTKSDVEQALAVTAMNVSRKAKRNAPVDTGRLRSSISVERTGALSRAVHVGDAANVRYAQFQEFGTGQRGRASAIEPPAGYEYGTQRGIPAQPFLTPAWQSEKLDHIRRVRKALGD
jgi:HK97 gp10 family phage protein